MNPDDLAKLGSFTNERIALLLCMTIQVAAVTYPNELREALATCFDLTGYEKGLEKLRIDYQKAVAAMAEVNGRLKTIQAEADQFRAEIDALRRASEGGDDTSRPTMRRR